MLYLQEKLIEAITPPRKTNVGFVSGPIFSLNPIQSVVNIFRMKKVQKEARNKFHYSIYSALDFFTPSYFIDYLMMEIQGGTPHGKTLWIDVINAGIITDLFMCPGWEKSKGAREEYSTAKDLNLKVHNAS